MLFQIDALKHLRFSSLMEVYEEGNRENGRDQYPRLSGPEQILAAERDFYQYLELFFSTGGSRYLIWELDGCYVSALRLEPYQDGLLLEGLETRPSERRKGFATKLINAVIENLDDCELPVYSHISKWNEASIRTHEKCGFKRILDYCVYIDGSVNQNAYTYRFCK
jgi:RimJ/RimL family protein N-acetyltransferase